MMIRLTRWSVMGSLALAAPAFAEPSATPPPPAAAAPDSAPLPAWRKLTTEPYRGKQDDVHFISPDIGWYVNGTGRIFRTTDGGATFTMQLEKKGTFFRCVAFLDEQRGFAGNIGTNYFPGVTDTTPLYATADGGATWNPVTIEGDPVTGLCALEVVRTPFINAGTLDHKVRIVGGGRVGGPAVFVSSEDEGKTWRATDLSARCGMVLDVHFFDAQHGVIAAATSAEVEQSSTLILTTADGGATWTKAHQGTRPWELTWKISFPTRDVGYVTVQSYNPDPAASQRFILKTTDAGKSWSELPLVNDAAVREFGVGFMSENIGWVGAVPGGFQTTDGGQTWTRVEMGNAVNKIRILKTPTGHVGYAIGTHLHRIDVPSTP